MVEINPNADCPIESVRRFVANMPHGTDRDALLKVLVPFKELVGTVSPEDCWWRTRPSRYIEYYDPEPDCPVEDHQLYYAIIMVVNTLAEYENVVFGEHPVLQYNYRLLSDMLVRIVLHLGDNGWTDSGACVDGKSGWPLDSMWWPDHRHITCQDTLPDSSFILPYLKWFGERQTHSDRNVVMDALSKAIPRRCMSKEVIVRYIAQMDKCLEFRRFVVKMIECALLGNYVHASVGPKFRQRVSIVHSLMHLQSDWINAIGIVVVYSLRIYLVHMLRFNPALRDVVCEWYSWEEFERTMFLSMDRVVGLIRRSNMGLSPDMDVPKFYYRYPEHEVRMQLDIMRQRDRDRLSKSIKERLKSGNTRRIRKGKNVANLAKSQISLSNPPIGSMWDMIESELRSHDRSIIKRKVPDLLVNIRLCMHRAMHPVRRKSNDNYPYPDHMPLRPSQDVLERISALVERMDQSDINVVNFGWLVHFGVSERVVYVLHRIRDSCMSTAIQDKDVTNIVMTILNGEPAMFVTIYAFTECIRQRRAMAVYRLPDYLYASQAAAWVVRNSVEVDPETCVEHLCRSCPNYRPKLNEPRQLVKFRCADGSLRMTYIYTPADLFSIGGGAKVLDPFTGDIFCGRKPPLIELWKTDNPVLHGDLVSSYLDDHGNLLPPYHAPVPFDKRVAVSEPAVHPADNYVSDDDDGDDDGDTRNSDDDSDDLSDECILAEMKGIATKRGSVPASMIRPMSIRPCHETELVTIHLVGQVYSLHGKTYGICSLCAMKTLYCLTKYYNGKFVCGACIPQQSVRRFCKYCATSIPHPIRSYRLWNDEASAFEDVWFCKTHTFASHAKATRLSVVLKNLNRNRGIQNPWKQ